MTTLDAARIVAMDYLDARSHRGGQSIGDVPGARTPTREWLAFEGLSLTEIQDALDWLTAAGEIQTLSAEEVAEKARLAANRTRS